LQSLAQQLLYVDQRSLIGALNLLEIHMNFKKLAIATSLALAAISASATPLDSLVGNVNIKLVGLTTESNTNTTTNETTWGIGAITQIGGTGGQTWTAGTSDGTYLYYMLYGIADQTVIFNAATNKYDIYNIGAAGGVGDGLIHLDIYRTTTRMIDIDSDLNASPLGRTGYDSYAQFAALGPAYLTTTFVAGKGTDVASTAADESLATLVQSASNAVLKAGIEGDGKFYADVTGGTAYTQWNTNKQGGADFDGSFTLKTNGDSFGSGVCTDAQIETSACFTGLINDPIRANKIPEPGSLALFGLALAGLAGVSRRKSK
jgi:hypothetical protein